MAAATRPVDHSEGPLLQRLPGRTFQGVLFPQSAEQSMEHLPDSLAAQSPGPPSFRQRHVAFEPRPEPLLIRGRQMLDPLVNAAPRPTVGSRDPGQVREDLRCRFDAACLPHVTGRLRIDQGHRSPYTSFSLLPARGFSLSLALNSRFFLSGSVLQAVAATLDRENLRMLQEAPATTSFT